MANTELECSEITPWAKQNSTNPQVGCGDGERGKDVDPQNWSQKSILTGMEVILRSQIIVFVGDKLGVLICIIIINDL